MKAQSASSLAWRKCACQYMCYKARYIVCYVMERAVPKADLDRYLKRRGDGWNYYRRVPESVGDLDPRFPTIRKGLGTRDLAVARHARNVLEAADNQLWAALLADDRVDQAQAHHAAVVARAKAFGFGYVGAAQIAAGDWQQIAARFEALESAKGAPLAAEALLGLSGAPAQGGSNPDRFDDALKIYIEGPGAMALAEKSKDQLRKWRVIPERAIRTFKQIVGDRRLEEISRTDAVTFYYYWLAKVSPDDDDTEAMSASSANRQIGELRKLYREYFNFVHHDHVRQNPFDNLSFSERGKSKRPPFSDEWIKRNFLAGGRLSGLNREARGVLLASIETGCRPSELCNLTARNIILDHGVPHLHIRPRVRRDKSDEDAKEFGPRQLKTEASERRIPLVGVSAAAFAAFPGGFQRYFGKAEAASATINSFLSENGLMESDRHTFYSIRHAFEDRMKRASIAYDTRRGLFGHTLDRPEYGENGGLQWLQTELSRMAFDFEPTLLAE